jgi:hypothetical protein
MSRLRRASTWKHLWDSSTRSRSRAVRRLACAARMPLHFPGSAAGQVAEDREKLEENGGGVGLGVRSNGADGETCETVKGGFAQLWSHRRAGRGG